ncbi:MAG TPA: SURF1 family protein [Gammaproteobacteria bacterium]|nr:SURF1 family protein [Gammaproteobacteria bacterium]
MRIGPFDFRPRTLPTLVTLVLFPVLLSLGFWQLDRAQQKRDLIAQWQESKHEAPRPLAEVDKDGSSKKFFKVQAKGRYDRDHQFLLDNQVRDGRPGFQVLTPLKLAGRDKAVLVERGWLPMGKSRQDLPHPPTPEKAVRIQGFLADPPSVGIRLGPPDPGQGKWPKVVQYVKAGRIGKQLGYPVMGRVIRLAQGQPYGFRRHWSAPVHFGPQRHIGYAVQWFALAAALVTIYLVVNTKRSKPRNAEPTHDQGRSGIPRQ